MSRPKKIYETVPGTKDCVLACVTKPPKLIKKIHGMEIYKGKIKDESGDCDIVFFNSKYSALALETGVWYFFYGRFDGTLVRRETVNPYYEKAPEDRCGGMVPVYPLTAGLTQKTFRKAVNTSLEDFDFSSGDILSNELRLKHGLSDREYALRNIHNPKNEAELAIARKRLVFEEMLIFNLALASIKKQQKKETANPVDTGIDMSPFYSSLPFEFTNAQKRAVSDCISDFKTGLCMNRLVQGDVGCGKTAVASALMYMIAKNGYQCALMAPTEVLANQHYNDLSVLFSSLGLRTVLLTGSMKAKEKKDAVQKAESGEADIVIGTHALLSENVKYKNLCLVVTDEQHRFGVSQRDALRQKGKSPHVLVMSATPIPRTLAMVLYAELDISVIDELPPGRKPVKTYAVGNDMRERLYGFVKKEILNGRQAYIICAKTEDEEEKSDLANTRDLCEELRKGFLSGINVEYIHGKMAQSKKDEIMAGFVSGKIQALVSTTVIEVGVNVANSTCMVIENAERFGLSSLHQLRGRVGRGSDQSYCILVSDDPSENALSRLDIMTKTNDGFKISERDLEIRGPGEFFGERQSGLVRFHIANLMTDMAVIKESRSCAGEILRKDPSLSSPANRNLKNAVKEILERYAV